MLNRISKVTKHDIFDLFKIGLQRDSIFEPNKISYCYHGRLTELQFLERLYNLNDMESLDFRYNNAKEDIIQHTINNDDYLPCWVFDDERFMLENGDDERFLNFLCEVFHPEVRLERGCWTEFFNEINKLLKNDGYELYSLRKISNRDVFTWQIADTCENKLFIPYSQRNKGVVKNQKSIRLTARKQIYHLLEKFNMTYYETDETGFNYTMSLSEIVLDEIKQFYTPKSYNNAKQYVETDSLENFVCFGSPLNVIDTIELFANNLKDNNFEIQINQILKLNELPLRLGNRRIISNLDSQVTLQTPEFIQEVGLKELIQEAVDFYETGKVKIGVEKLWDAFERLKTYYSPTLDKKKSIEKILEDMSKGKKEFKDMYELEFRQLTKIGNDFRIRHHETTKINIDSEIDYDYFYKRCMSLLSTATQSLKYKI
ncbi:hypothetical protein HBP70_06075 [Listeria welshimeri]|nr:hypothetical protein [Listeria welshimeri]MBC2359573.1 hypothetical protein [Listeria welshimeri]MBC2363698.1 hypothetical protein [Listeria welshimeri]